MRFLLCAERVASSESTPTIYDRKVPELPTFFDALIAFRGSRRELGVHADYGLTSLRARRARRLSCQIMAAPINAIAVAVTSHVTGKCD